MTKNEILALPKGYYWLTLVGAETRLPVYLKSIATDNVRIIELIAKSDLGSVNAVPELSALLWWSVLPVLDDPAMTLPDTAILEPITFKDIGEPVLVTKETLSTLQDCFYLTGTKFPSLEILYTDERGKRRTTPAWVRCRNNYVEDYLTTGKTFKIRPVELV